MSRYNMYESNTSLSDLDSQTNESQRLIESGNGSGQGHLDSTGERAHMILSQPHTIIALVLAFLAISMNMLSALAILHQQGALSSHYRFILSLLLSDILTGTNVILHFVNQIYHPIYPWGVGPSDTRLRSYCMRMVLRALKTTALNSSLLNLMGMAIDHFLAILKPLHYPSLMNKQRASIFIGTFWLIATVCGFSDFLSGYPKYRKFKHINYCEFVYLTKYQEEYTVFAIAALCFVTMIFTYIRILSTIRKRHRNLEQLRLETVHRNKKAVITTLLILGTFVLCWLPTCLFQITMIIAVYVNRDMVFRWHRSFPILAKVDPYLFDLLLINAICDPLIYATRMPEIRNGYKRICLQCASRKKRRPGGELTNTSMLLTSFKSSMKNPEFHPKKVAKTNSLLMKGGMDVVDV